MTKRLSITIVIIVIAFYGRTLAFGFDWDDYHFVRTFTASEVISSFSGPWDASGIEAAFYRPAAIAWFGLRAWAFGPDAFALHAVNVGLLLVVLGLFGYWLHLMKLSAGAVLAGMLALAVNPLMAPAVAWITNQMHLLQMALLMLALVLTVQGRWRWLLPVQIAALLFKEDSLMFPLAIALTASATGQDIPRRWIVASVLLSGAFLAVRTAALAGVGGYQPNFAGMITNAATAPLAALLVPPFNGYGAALALVALAVLAWRSASDKRLLLMIGLFMMFNAPLVLSSGPTRWHMLALALSGLLAVSVHVLRHAHWIQPATCAVIVGLAVGGWTVTNRWQPCGAVVRSHDADVRAWGESVPENLQAELAAKTCTVEQTTR